MAAPTVSVILPVYNGAADVPKSVASILGQGFRDFELIVIDDCSPTDNSAEVIQALQREHGDPRMRIELLPQNRGLAGALNHGIGLARGRYIARQDQDDLSLPDRLAEQVAFLDAHPECGLLGTRAEIWIGDEPTGRLHAHPAGDAALQFALLFNNPFVHSSVMMPRAALEAVGLYCTDRSRQPPEDYELWSRIARRFPVANLERPLLVYREVPQSMSRTGPNPFLEKLITIGAENLAFANGLPAPDAACRETVALMNAAYHQATGTVPLAAMEGLIRGAARAIEVRRAGADLAAPLREALANLRHHHAASGGGGATVEGRDSLIAAVGRRLRRWMG